jgi:hypothetical protein
VVGQEPVVVEKLRAQTQHQLAVHPFGLLGAAAQKILNRLLEPVHSLFGVALDRNRDELVRRARRMALLPMQAIGVPNRPISTQPEGQASFRAFLAALQILAVPRVSLRFAPCSPSAKRRLRDPERL